MIKKRISLKKILSMLLALAMVLTLIPASVFAAGEAETLYLKPNSNWESAGARFAAYFFGDSGEKWVDMTDADGDGIYEAQIPAGNYANVIFCRMSPTTTANTWNNKWNQTGDLKVPTDGKMLYTINAGQWDSGQNGKWSAYVPVEPVYVVAGASSLCGSNWDITDTANQMTKNASGIYEKVYTNVAAGTYEFKVVRDKSWDISWPSANYKLTVTEDGCKVTVTFDPATKTVSATAQLPAAPQPGDYFLVGIINGFEYSGEDYKFENGKLAVTFEADSYVAVKNGSGDWYMCEAYCTDTSAVLTKGHSENLFVPAGTEWTFTLEENEDGTLTLRYEATPDEGGEEGGEEIPNVTYEATFHFANTLGWGVVNLYTWSEAGSTLTGSWPGSATSQDANGFYTTTVRYEAPEGQGLNYIYNNGAAQTVDLSLPSGAFDADHKAEIWVVLSNQTDGKYNVNTYTSGDAIAVSPIVKEDSVTFQYKAPAAASVEVRGTMCGWEEGQGVAMTKNSYGIWSVTIEHVTPGIHEYQFLVDGSLVTDPLNTWKENGHSAFLISDPGKDVNLVTVIVHYNRTDGKYDNWNLYMWNEHGASQYDFTAGQGEVTTTIQVEGRATQSVNFKVRKSVGSNKWAAEEGQVTVDLTSIVSGTIHVYTGGKYANTQTMEDDVVYANKLSDVQYDYEHNTITISTNKTVSQPETGFGLVKDDVAASWTYDETASTSGKYVFRLTEEPSLAELYRYKVRFYEQAEAFHSVNYAIGIDTVYATDRFAAEYTYQGDDLGAAYQESCTTFRLWAPTASAVAVQLYATGSDAEAGAAELGTYPMQKDVNGTWIVTIDGDLSGTYYTYLATVNGKTVEANDPYSVSTGVNGKRSMVTDLDATDPDGWYEDKNPNPVTSQTDAVIYELHVRDFSIDDSSGVSEANRGKFLAFTEEGTTVSGKGEIVSGVDYLADLGITHLHLLPIYDYESVDETTSDSFNWGYDPQNYNVPEGSYSTNPYDGNVRVNEMKQMVMALHDNGISVVMDVVYNHVYDASTFSFNQIVPGYFSRVDSNTSGCGNDTASEREMVRKYIVDSILYWVEEYHIDGFRFDLVGLIDVQTINEIVSEVHAVRPDVIFYGEGWDMDGTNKEPGTVMAKQGNASKTPGFAYFSDSMRNNLGGNNEGTATGFASGAANGASMATEWLANPWWTNNPQQVVQYASCHDNYTLADKIILSTGRKQLDATVVKMNNLAAAFYLTSQGMPFVHAGEELLREKLNADGSRNHNSYNSSDEVNHIEWSNLEKDTYRQTSAYYQGLIAFRKAHPALRYSTAALIKENVQTRQASGNLVVMRIDGYGAGDDDILVIFNASAGAQTVTLPEGEWEIFVQGNLAGTQVLGTANGALTVEGISACVLTREDTGKDEVEPLGATSEKTIYFSNNKYWSKIYAYAWTDKGETLLLGAWPGTAMTFVEKNDYGEDIYAVTLPASETGIEGLIFSDGSANQTVDIQPGVDGTGYYCTDADAEGKFQVGTYTYRAPQIGSADEYFLGGWINGADYAGDQYPFVDGTLTATFHADSYVYVVNGTGSTTYMTDGWVGSVTQVTLYDSSKLAKADKLMIPGGVEVTMTLVENTDGTLTLSYQLSEQPVVDGTGVQNGLTLHCWNWSFAQIEANMATIAAQGYTAVQTSPVQVLKEATNLDGHTVGGNWWVYYQPVDFVITTDSGNALGTKAELQSMIETAHKYGVKVIVDVVANHLGNQTGNDLSDQIPEYLLKDEYWHDITTDTTNWNDRYDITQHCMGGLPDLNTANKELQNIVLRYLKELVDVGVDGFRFDGAKHIETPMDAAAFASDFWPTVVGGAESYAQTTYGKDLYVYGEVLDTTGGVSLSGYTQYMAVTDNSWGNTLRKNIEAGNAALAAGYDKAAAASLLVLWAESHDTYMTDDSYLHSADTTQANISKTWALVAARADAMGLYFARPESLKQAIGVASVTGWANAEIAQINKFHNAFVGQEEVVSNENGISYVERGTSGVVLVQVSKTAGSNVSVTAHAMAEGTYVDQLTGNTFTVADGKISGQIGETGIAVVYTPEQEPEAELIKWVGTQVQANSNLDMQFALKASDFEDLTGCYIVLTRHCANGTVDVLTIPQADWTVSGNFYIVAYSGIAAKEMGDVIEAVVYNAADEAISELRAESIETYALSMLGKITNPEQKTMFVDLLNYGAEAQKYFGHNTDKLVNAGLTEEQKTWATQEDVEVTDNRVKDESVFGTQLSLENVVLLQAAFNPATPTADEGTCETAQELADNIIRGWNLGCSLSVVSKPTISSYTGLIGMSTDDGKYSRSEYLTFDDKTGSVTLDWAFGQDGMMNAGANAAITKLFVEQWNFALTENDTCTFTVEEFTYTLKSGKVVSLIDAPLTMQTDMSDGTGYIDIADSAALQGLLVRDILSIHCVMSFGELNDGEATVEEIAAMETAWGNPVTTQEMIDTVVDRGFNLIRIQVSFLNHMDAEGNIDKLWLDRVQEVVDYCMNAGVYCVINTSGYMWMTCDPADWEVQKPIYTNLWKQISERFAGYGEKLIFESCNEVLYAEGLWSNPPAEAYEVMHEIHQTFVDTVRAGGSYNETRNLMLNPYAAGYDYAMNKNFTLPTDTVEGHLLAQVHCYVPQDFTFNETNLGSTNFRYEWGTEEDKKQLDETLLGIKKRFIDELGIPVVIGEFGIAKRLSESEATEYISFYAATADKYDIQLILFDDGLDIAVFDRNNLTWTRPQVIDALFAQTATAVAADTDPLEGMTAQVTYTNYRGVRVTETAQVENNNGFAMVSVNSLAFADYETMVTITLYNADGVVVGTVTDSMASYAARANNTLAKALMKFCASAYNYFM